MTNKTKSQKELYPEYNHQDSKMFSKSEMNELFCRRTSLFTLYCAEPEPVYYNGRCIYV